MSAPVHDRVRRRPPPVKRLDHEDKPVEAAPSPEVSTLHMLQRRAGNAAVAQLARARRGKDAEKEMEKGLSGAKAKGNTSQKSRKDAKKEAAEEAKRLRWEKSKAKQLEEEHEGEGESAPDAQQAALDALNEAPSKLQALLLQVRTVQTWLGRDEDWDMEPEMRALVRCVVTMQLGEHGSRWRYLQDDEQRVEILERIADLIEPLLARLKSPGDYESMLVVHGSYIFGPRKSQPGDVDLVDADEALGDVDAKTGISGLTKGEQLIRHPKSGNLTVGAKGGPIDLVGGVRILGANSLNDIGVVKFWQMSAKSCWKLLNNAGKQDSAEKQVRWLMQAGFVLFHTLAVIRGTQTTAAADFASDSEAFRANFALRLAIANDALVGRGKLGTDFDVLYKLLHKQYERTDALLAQHPEDFAPAKQSSSSHASGSETKEEKEEES